MSDRKLDNTSIEEIGINTLERPLLYSGTLAPVLTKREKQPIWDGNIMLYKEGGKNNNEFLIDKNPVQVKAKTNKNVPSKTYSHSVSVNELNIFLRDGGIAYFVVYVHPTEPEKCKVFYSFLAPVDLVRFINSAGSQKTITVKMEEFPEMSKQVENSFLDFYNDCKKQASFSKPIFLKDVENDVESFKISFTVESKDRKEWFKYLTTHKTFVYVTFKGDPTKTPHPLGDRRYKLKAFQEVELDISIKEKTYFNKCIAEIENGNLFIVIPDVMRFAFPMELSDAPFEGKVHINTVFRTLSQQIHILNFLIDVINEGGFYVGGVKMSVSDIGQDDLDHLQGELEGANNLQKVLSELHVEKDLDVSDLSKEDINNINTIISKFIYNKPIEFTDLKPPRFAKMDIADVSILFFVDKDQSDKIRLTSAYDLSMFVFTTEIENGDRRIVIPPYVGYDAEIFCDVCNINYSDFLPSFKEKRTVENRFYQSMNWTILRMLMGYDAQIKKNSILLETAFEMAKWLEDNDPDRNSHFIHVINCLQIKKRLNIISREDEECLVNILEMKECNDELKFAAYLLLDDKNMAKRYFLKLDKTTRDLYQSSLPLYNLIKNEL